MRRQPFALAFDVPTGTAVLLTPRRPAPQGLARSYGRTLPARCGYLMALSWCRTPDCFGNPVLRAHHALLYEPREIARHMRRAIAS